MLEMLGVVLLMALEDGCEMNGCLVVEDGRGGKTNCGVLAEMLETHCSRVQGQLLNREIL